jgi:tRNA threonylcarbamoyl adenosine modification protein YeaZ
VLQEIVLPRGREHLENLAPLVQQILDDRQILLEDFDGLAAAVGPGSFSGIRIGLATVKGMALALSKPVVGISSLDVLAWQAVSEGETGACFIDARRSEVYTALYRRGHDDLEVLDGPMLVKVEDVSRLADRLNRHKLVICGETDIVEAVAKENPDFVPSRVAHPSPGALASLAERYFLRGKGRGVHELTPQYIRRSDAEEKARVAGSGLQRGGR